MVLFSIHQPIDVLITDIRLTGDVDGCHLARNLLQRQPSLRLIVISGDVPMTVPGLDPESYWTLNKPFATEALMDILKLALGV
jgi:FixJ family two-component response regulator